MAAPSEIEKLERRYAENPDGRFFAPLADAYRKAGNVTRALELVRAGLGKHPDYLSAHIVLGRCLLDKGDDAEAEQTFRSVLDLDAENIIALKSLAEITERTGRTSDARRWLQKLLVVDSMNVEAEADLQRLGGVIAEQQTQPIEAVQVEAGPEVSFADIAREVDQLAAVAPPLTDVAPAPAPEPAVTAAPEPAIAAAPEPAVTAAPEPAIAAAAEPAVTAAPEPVIAAAAEPAVSAAPEPPVEPVLATPEPAPAIQVEAPPPPLEPVAEPQLAAAPEGFVPMDQAQTPSETTAPPEPVGLPPLTPDRHPLADELQVADGGLELMPFDDSLAWGTGERSSRAIRAEDIAAVAHDDNLTTPAVEFISGLESAAAAPPPAEPPAERVDWLEPSGSEPTVGQVAWIEPPGAVPAAEQVSWLEPSGAEPGDFAVERQDDQQFFGTEAAEKPPNVELPADLSGAYSIIDMPEAQPAEAAAPAPEPASGLPLILPEDVTPAEELARPSAKLVQMVSPAPPREEHAGQAEQPMLTETLGDLYLSQGFRSEAADVYRRLLTQRPNDEGLRAKVRALEAPPVDLSAAALGAESVGVWLSRVAAARLGAPAPPGPAEPPPGPSPLEAAFAAPVAEPPGEPAHPAQDAFSLDQIFGSPSESPSPGPSNVAAASAPPPAPGASFDEFFGAPPEAGSVRPVVKAPDEPAQGGDEDLSAFNAWLQGLKR